MTIYTQGNTSIWLEDVNAIEVFNKDISFYIQGRVIAITYVDAPAASAEYGIVIALWEEAKNKPVQYDRATYVRSIVGSIIEGLASNQAYLDRVSFLRARNSYEVDEEQIVDYAFVLAELAADNYEVVYP
jgi:hypothetical protein